MGHLPWYQPPLPADQVKASPEFEYEGDGMPAARGRGSGGRGRGRGRGRPRVVSDYLMSMMKRNGMALVTTPGAEDVGEAAITVVVEGEVIITTRIWMLHKMGVTIMKHQCKDELKRLKKQDKGLSGDLTPYNIVPLEAPSLANAIGFYPEKDNIRNQRENIVLSIANAQSRLGIPVESDPTIDEMVQIFA